MFVIAPHTVIDKASSSPALKLAQVIMGWSKNTQSLFLIYSLANIVSFYVTCVPVLLWICSLFTVCCQIQELKASNGSL